MATLYYYARHYLFKYFTAFCTRKYGSGIPNPSLSPLAAEANPRAAPPARRLPATSWPGGRVAGGAGGVRPEVARGQGPANRLDEEPAAQR